MRKNLVFTPLMAILAAGGLCAQDTTTAVLTGRVTSQNNLPLAGVSVLLESPSMLGVRQVPTDADGQFRVPLLPNGEYTVTYTLNGYITRRLTLRLIAGQTANGSVRLIEMTAQEATVKITGETTAAVDKSETVVQTVYSMEHLEAISGRSLNAMIPMVAGMVTSSIEGNNNISIRGGSNRGAQTLINGTSVTEQSAGSNMRLSILPDLIESVAVIQAPLNARYGNTDGGIISMVTAKGSNTFTGTLRNTIGRSYWSAVDQFGYPRRDGTSTTSSVNTTDLTSREFELSLQGPIWKDHVTFAYGTKLTPKSYWNIDKGTRLSDMGNGQWGEARNTVGTYYQASNGDVIRNAEQFIYAGNANGIRAGFPASDWNSYNQYTLYVQINPSHQLEYSYMQDEYKGVFDGDMVNYVGIDELDNNNYSVQITRRINWNLSYKGLVGASGVLETRYAKSRIEWAFGTPGKNPNPIIAYAINSFIPIDRSGDLGDLNNYLANGYAWPSVGDPQYLNVGYDINTYRGYGTYIHNGLQAADVDGGGNTALILNYQHFLNTAKGNHIIDVGFQGDDFKWQKKADAPGRTRYYAPGLISRTLSDNEIYNVNTRTWGGDASQYRGMYIVWDMSRAMLSDIDPWGVANKGIINAPVFGGNYTYSHPLVANFAPRVDIRSGDFPGFHYTTMNTIYINDLWTINYYHSVMGGLRIDNYEMKIGNDDSRLKYTQPTFRFEYKWDVYGNQRRLLNVSWGQFHSKIAANIYQNLVQAPSNDVQTMYWNRPNPDGSNKPYLVNKDDLMNLDNYGLMGQKTLAAGSMWDVSPDWKQPISTEFSVGFRSNLSGGGFLKATFVYRTWSNDGLGYYPGDFFTESISGQLTVMRVLQNSDGYERTYKGIELEWELPLHKRMTFGGNWTWNRLMHNSPGIVDVPTGGGQNSLRFDTYWDYMTGSRDAWAPIRLINPEHYINFYFLFDLTSGKINSALTLRGSYTSGSPRVNQYQMHYGFPTDFEPRYQQLIQGVAGGTVPGTSGTTSFSNATYIPYNIHGTNADSWGLNLRYTLSMPLVRKLSWLATIDVSNPFNHRGLSGWTPPVFTSDQAVRPYPFESGTGSPVGSNFPYGGNGNDISGYVPRATGDLLSLYTGRQGGRVVSLQTGLRF
ncbi:MAG: TonB-dependent receptor [Holophagales bacterium]|jgi:hypothetical protein|nr:TonB-dependent receptor [Holophagales bacterium]